MDYGWRKVKLNQENNKNKSTRFFTGWKKILFAFGLVGLFTIIVLSFLGATKAITGSFTTYTVKKGELTVDIVETGSIESSESQDIKSEVEGMTTIISIVPEGTILTEKDIEEKKLLVELDSSDLRKKRDQQVITVDGGRAVFTDAKESYDIQIKQNESNIREGELKIKFGKMDLEKYLGEKSANLFIEGKADLLTLITSSDIGGESLQRKRKLENDIDLSKEELARAKVKLDWTIKLEAKGYVTRDDLQADQLALKRRQVDLEQANISLELFKRYEFQKEAEKRRSDYQEAVTDLERVRAKCRAELSKAEARLKSSEATYTNQSDQLKKLEEQIEKCRIIATKPGLVVYAGADRPWQQEIIKEGTQVRERQDLIKIPNTSLMVVKAKIHESIITRVEEGQKAIITIDALPDKTFSGSVKKVGILPDSQNRWLNPNVKVYETQVTIEGNHPALKPGMSAQVKIIINELKDVLMVPLEAVTTKGDDRVCYVEDSPNKSTIRKIETGDYNDKFMEIKNGLKEGEKVVLNTSSITGKGEVSTKEKEKVAKVVGTPTQGSGSGESAIPGGTGKSDRTGKAGKAGRVDRASGQGQGGFVGPSGQGVSGGSQRSERRQETDFSTRGKSSDANRRSR